MPIRKSRAINFKAHSLSDTFDSTNSFAGAMAALTNLIPAPQTADAWVPRPASTLTTSFAGFTTPANGEALFSIGTRTYGFIQSGRNAGHSEPFIYDTQASAFVTIAGITAGNTPVSTANTGDWIPPTIDQVGGYVIFTHPGFSLPNAFGWLDMTGFSSTTITGNTHTTTTVDTLSTNVLAAGWTVGKLITDSAGDIPAGTTIVSIAANGLSLVLSAAATGSNAGTTFTVTGGTVAAPRWSAGNLSGIPLVAVATAVAQYAGSACYAVNTTSPPSAAVVFSDSGSPLVCTNANQIVTFRNSIAVTALKGLPLNALTGGIIQSLIAFQGPSAIQQITGAPITTNLSVNSLNEATGTLAPNSVQSTPKGLMFAAPDGIRRINFFGIVSDVMGRRGGGVTTPFLFATNPSRMAAAYNESVYRISVQNGSAVGTPTQEYWYHEDDQLWTGPHTFPFALIVATQVPHSFAGFAAGIPAKLWNTDAYASQAATYVENGVQMTYNWQTSLLPDTQQMNMNAMIQTNISIAIPAQQNVQFTATDEQGAGLGISQLSGAGLPPSLWGTMLWGVGIWGAGAAYFRQRHVIWPAPIVFKQMQVMAAGNCIGGLEIGNLEMRYSELGYNLLTNTAA